MVGNFGYDINVRNRRTIAASLNKLLSDIKGKKEQNLIDTLTIRTMSKAVVFNSECRSLRAEHLTTITVILHHQYGGTQM